MLYLDARIHLDEIELVVRVHQELHRPGILVADLAQAPAQRPAQFLTQFWRYLQTRRLFEQLLVPPLDRALALEQ